jgi:hypothetical protein
MTEEYQKSREHWLRVVISVIVAPNEKRDELFEEAVALYQHMRIVSGQAEKYNIGRVKT